MAVKFNPFTGQLQIDEKGASASYIDGEVATYNDLPLSSTTAPLNTAWLVRSASGVWPVSRKQAGIYIRTATGGVSRDADFTYAGTMPDVFSDAVFTLYDDASTTRTGQFNLGSVTAGQNRVLTWPDGNGTIALTTTVVDNATGLWDSANSVTGATVADYELSVTNGTDTSSLTFPVGASRNYTLPNAAGTLALTSDFAAPPAIGSTTRNTGAFTTLSANNGTLTASAPVLDLSQTWNNAAVTFTGLRFNATDTASAAASNLAEFQLSGTALAAIRKDGSFRVLGTGDRTLLAHPNFALSAVAGGAWLGVNTTISLSSAGNFVTAGGLIRLNDVTSANPVELNRDAADTLAQRRTTNPQAYRIYNTTDAGLTNFERGFIGWSSNTLRIGTEKGGTGSARALEFQTDGITRFTLAAANTATFAGGLALQWGGGGTRIIGATFPSNLLQLQTASTDRLVINDTLVAFGSATNAFPALKRSSTTLQVRLADDSAFAPLEALSFTTANSRIVCDDANTVIHVGNTPRISLYGATSTYLGLGSAHDIRWSNTGRSDQATSFNISLARDADGILAQRAGTTAQTWRLYNTVSGTGNVNFERANLRWASNEFIIDAEAGGTGTSLRGIKIGSATSSLLGFYGATPVDRPATVADPTGGGTIDTEARTAINDIIDRLQELGLIA